MSIDLCLELKLPLIHITHINDSPSVLLSPQNAAI